MVCSWKLFVTSFHVCYWWCNNKQRLWLNCLEICFIFDQRSIFCQIHTYYADIDLLGKMALKMHQVYLCSTLTFNLTDAFSFNIFNESAATPYFCFRSTVVILYPFKGFLPPPKKPNIIINISLVWIDVKLIEIARSLICEASHSLTAPLFTFMGIEFIAKRQNTAHFCMWLTLNLKRVYRL